MLAELGVGTPDGAWMGRGRHEAPPKPGEHIGTLIEPDSPADLFIVALRRSASDWVTRADHRQRLLDQLVTNMIERRLSIMSHDPASPLLAAPASTIYQSRTHNLLRIFAEPRAGTLADASRQVLLELERIERHQFLGSELELARTLLRRQLDNRRGSAWTLGREQRWLSPSTAPRRLPSR